MADGSFPNSSRFDNMIGVRFTAPRNIQTVCMAMCWAAGLGVATAPAPHAHADPVAYLVNVTVRPGYGFPNADAALGYGYGICDKLSGGEGYGQLIGDLQADFHTADDYQASYLITQSVNELCPALIWRLRNSAAHDWPPPRDDG